MICFGQTWSREIKMFSGLEDLNFPSTNETQQIEETATEVQGIDMEGSAVAPHPRSSRPNSKRSKNFDLKKDLVVVSAWLNMSKDHVHGANQSNGTFWSGFMLTLRRTRRLFFKIGEFHYASVDDYFESSEQILWMLCSNRG